MGVWHRQIRSTVAFVSEEILRVSFYRKRAGRPEMFWNVVGQARSEKSVMYYITSISIDSFIVHYRAGSLVLIPSTFNNLDVKTGVGLGLLRELVGVTKMCTG